MNHHRLLYAALTLAVTCRPASLPGQQVDVYFSPRGGCATAIAAHLARATTSIDVAAFILTSRPLSAELANAANRGVHIRLLLDSAQETNTTCTAAQLRSANTATRADRIEKIHHNKYAVIDGATTITGSYNWTDNAENRNAENLIVIHDRKTAALYTADFNRHWSHSTPFLPHPPRSLGPRSPRATFHPLTNPHNRKVP